MLGRSRACLLVGSPCDERSIGATTAGETRCSEAATSLLLSFTETHAPRDTSISKTRDANRPGGAQTCLRPNKDAFALHSASRFHLQRTVPYGTAMSGEAGWY